ncbi:MAG: PQQ-binding-like beta-propeller repeat protein [Candidatus Latescibacterota bacterium]
MSVHVVSDIDVRDSGAECLKVGDLNGDGAPDLLFVQSVYGTRQVTCLTACTIQGEVLWQVGSASPDNGRVYSDLPVQLYDWDGDGRNEVLYVEQAEYLDAEAYGGWARERARAYAGQAALVVLDAATGQERRRFSLPAPADDCFLFADLTGRGRREDLVVKDRYWNLWGVSHAGEVLWHWAGSTGHFPAIGDVDGDGCDEVFVGFALLDHDGREVFAHDCGGAHQDAATVVRRADGRWLLAFGNGGVHCLDKDGSVRWEHPLTEAQHVVAARFRSDSEVQFAVLDRGQPRGQDRGPATLYLYDAGGRQVWHRVQPEGSALAAIVDLDWCGDCARRQILVYNRGPSEAIAVYDGEGEVVDVLGPPRPDVSYYATRADLWGDSREEVILFGPRFARICANARPLALATHYNQTLYPGM